MVDVVGVLALMNRGQALEEMAREFAGVMEAVRSNGGSGELNLKLRVDPKSWDLQGRLTEVQVTHHLNSKRPRRKLGASTFFVDREGGLSRNNPEQAELFDMHSPVDQPQERTRDDR